ncbi:slit homolog 1 protein-like [Strongylocentrotus purpuratus]|uniref:TIR domain-containing protein n=1 Tax=Strongylocentrotus purpuratus TaxID=7668 RepID=A0A7M7N215_STRPU|nr:slit homolog 1 protein-like [Strongylocentrotus purpuratus]
MDSLTRTLLFLIVIFLGGIVQNVRVDIPLRTPQPNYSCPVKPPHVAKCTRLNLTSVPQDLPHDLLLLFIHHNQITKLGNRSFIYYNRVTTLEAGYNIIALIEGGTFEPLPQLQVLKLDHNLITFLPIYYLQKNAHLVIINLSHNLISEISSTLVSAQKCRNLNGWRNMSAVNLSFNKLTTINENDFLPWRNCFVNKFNINDNHVSFLQPKAFRYLPKLGILNMNKINLATFDVEHFMCHVKIDRLVIDSSGIKYIRPANISSMQKANVPLIKELYLNLNILQDIPRYALRGFEKLQVLNFQGNRISSINNESFCGLHSLLDLSLSWNKIKSLPRASFACATNLQKIDLSRNNLAILDPQWFDGSWFLRTLMIDQSGIGRIAFGPWKATNLQTLVLNRNNMGFINNYTFTGLANLKKLDVSGNENRFRMSEDALTTVGSLEFLVMADVGKFTMKGLFRNMQNLSNLDISYNRLEILSIDQFTTTSALRVLNMSGSHLKAEDLVDKQTGTSLFSGLVSLRTLKLRRNSLATLHALPGIFTSLGSLVELDLTYCHIRQVASGTFANLTTLLQLSLQDNELTSVPRDAFQGLHKLQVLQLQYNSIAFIEQELFMGTNELKELYLQNNQISTVASYTLMPSSLIRLNIANNPLTCDCQLAWFRQWLNELAIVGYHEITEDQTPDDYEFQLNLMFHEGDEWWVNDCMKPFLEQRMPHLEHVIFGDADLHPGLFYLNAIYDVIENSHKTILLLSNPSVDDAWYMTKLRMAVEHMNDTKLEKVILVFLEDIDDDHLPYLVRLLLSRNKPYLLWTEDEEGQEVFWAKVQKSMRSNRQMNNVIPV